MKGTKPLQALTGAFQTDVGRNDIFKIAAHLQFLYHLLTDQTVSSFPNQTPPCQTFGTNSLLKILIAYLSVIPEI